jgi:hypothetical protein
MVMLFVADAAVAPDQLDPVAFDAVHRANVRAVGADNFHMLANVFEAAHGFKPPLLVVPTLRPPHSMHAALPNYACFGHESSAWPLVSLPVPP